MKSIIIGLGLGASVLALACSSAEQSAVSKSPASTRQTLSAVGSCAFAGCGTVPPGLANAPSVQCSSAPSEGCGWSASDADATTSYRSCAASECPPTPSIDCPAGTVHSSQQCGSENSAACVWTTVCAPPRDTTPCPDANGCGAEPALGVICKDGSNGALVCVTNGQACSWQRSCD
jgi:hypothetical protein